MASSNTAFTKLARLDVVGRFVNAQNVRNACLFDYRQKPHRLSGKIIIIGSLKFFD
jgi:hypothetical protein